MPTKIAISAGELSADEYAADFIRAFVHIVPDTQFRGMGGRNVRAAGMETTVDCETSGSVMGFNDVLGSFPKIWAALGSMKGLLRSWRPDVLVLIDYPDFNLKLAKFAHRLGIKILYYITPKVWVWRAGRVSLFHKYVDQAAVIFPFEKEFFESRGFSRSIYVGHPLAERTGDAVLSNQERRDFLAGLKLDPDRPVLAIFPGSRHGEIKRQFADVIGAIQILRARRPDLQYLLGLAPTVRELVGTHTGDLHSAGFDAVSSASPSILQASSVGLLKSGTSNLQAAFFGLPFVMFFKAPLFTEMLVRLVVNRREFSIINLLRPGTILELMQRGVNPSGLADAVDGLLADERRRSQLKQVFSEIVENLSRGEPIPVFEGCTRVSERVARLCRALAG